MILSTKDFNKRQEESQQKIEGKIESEQNQKTLKNI